MAGASDSAGGSEGAGALGSADGSGETGAIVPVSGERGVSVPPLPTGEHATVDERHERDEAIRTIG